MTNIIAKSKRKSIGRLKHKGGAPLKPVKRESGIRVRLSASERYLIGEKATNAGMVLSSWFRAAALNAKVVARLKPDDLRLLRMLAGLANNLNQLMKLAHKDGILIIARKCNDLLIDIHDILKKLNNDDRENP